ncbi:MAG: DUF2207 domain-containing protein [Clostridia bacterium]|nr:DUF2207 domain-containing protein [Clostridia bacterium]
MKKGYINPSTIIVVVYLFFFFISFASEFIDFSEINLNPWDYARITDVDYKAVLIDESGSNGKIHVTEKLTFDIHAFSKGNLFWELWRALPEKYEDGVKVDYNVLSVKEILPDGSYRVYRPASRIYWYDYEYRRGPYHWFHSPGPYNPDYDRYECVLMYVNGLYREKVQFEIIYEMNNAALRYADCSSLYLTMYSESTIKYLKSFKAEILIPDKDMPDVGNYKAGTYGTNSHTFNFTESDFKNPGYHTFIIDLDESELKFRPYNQYIEFTLLSYGKDRHKFTDYASRNRYYNDPALQEILDEQEEYDALVPAARSTKTKVLVIAIIVSVIILFSTTLTINKLYKDNTFYRPSINVQYFRDIPSNLDPYFAATLVFSKERKKKELKEVYSALMLSLVRKKYISLEKKDMNIDWTPKNTVFKILAKVDNRQAEPASNPNTIAYNSTTPRPSIMDRIAEMEKNPVTATKISKYYSDTYGELEELTPSEEAYLNLIYRYNRPDGLTMEQFQQRIKADYSNTDSFVKKVKRSVKNIGVLHGYFQTVEYDKEKNKMLAKAKSSRNWGLIFIIIVNFISHFTRLDYAYGAFTLIGIALLLKAYKISKIGRTALLYTQFGEDEYAKWKGLYDFLNSQTLMNEKTVVDLVLWEKYLVYATAFGISEKVIKALNIRCQEFELTPSPMFENRYYRSTYFRSSSRSFSSSVRSASRSYSSHMSSGGYYGGGRGGGGGGGGH